MPPTWVSGTFCLPVRDFWQKSSIRFRMWVTTEGEATVASPFVARTLNPVIHSGNEIGLSR
jgi:hypothetical protein